MRKVWPKEWPVFYRISAVDEGGWQLEDSVRFAAALRERGIDVIDCSSGSLHNSSTANVRLKRGFGFQVPFAAEIKRAADIKTMAVGLIVEPEQAEAILRDEQADLIAMRRRGALQSQLASSRAGRIGGTGRIPVLANSARLVADATRTHFYKIRGRGG